MIAAACGHVVGLAGMCFRVRRQRQSLRNSIFLGAVDTERAALDVVLKISRASTWKGGWVTSKQLLTAAAVAVAAIAAAAVVGAVASSILLRLTLLQHHGVISYRLAFLCVEQLQISPSTGDPCAGVQQAATHQAFVGWEDCRHVLTA